MNRKTSFHLNCITEVKDARDINKEGKFHLLSLMLKHYLLCFSDQAVHLNMDNNSNLFKVIIK